MQEKDIKYYKTKFENMDLVELSDLEILLEEAIYQRKKNLGILKKEEKSKHFWLRVFGWALKIGGFFGALWLLGEIQKGILGI